MAWEKVKLGDIAICIQPGPFGSQLHNSDYSESGTPIIMPKDMIDGKISHSNLIFVGEEHTKRLCRHQVHAGNLMVARKGDVRKCVFITENEDGWMTGSDCLKVALKENVCYSRFIYYQLRSPFIGRWLEKISIGATMPSINTGLLSGIELALPPLKEQKRIADILSAYDNLIENNQKQIKLLEEAAQRLYKQWFIDLRFPGHETTKIVNGLPEGWRKGSIGDIAEFKRGKVITKGDVVEGNVPVVAGGLEPAYYHNASFTESPVITVSGSGANAGFARMYFQKIWASDCSYVDSSATNFIYFTYSFLKENKKSLDSLQKGAAQPHVYAKDINALKLNCPPKDLLVKFEKSVKPLFDKIGKCQNVIEKSKDARDRLLPKLMSKKMEV